jgi:hypothetical protein
MRQGKASGLVAERRVIAILMITVFLKGVMWVALIPLWQAPDEYVHFAPIQFIAETGRLPGRDDVHMSLELCKSRYWLEVHHVAFRPMNRQSFEAGSHHSTEYQLAALPKEERWTPAEVGCYSPALHLPPLYYALSAVVYRLVYGGDLLTRAFAVRLFSVVLSTATTYVVWLITREVFPSRRSMRLTICAAVAFHPMFTFLGAAINSDNLLFFLSSALALMSVRIAVRGLTLRRALGAGGLIGLGILTKPQMLSILPALGLALLMAGWQLRRQWSRWLLLLAVMSVTALLAGGWGIYRSVQLNDSPLYSNPTNDIWGTDPKPDYTWTLVHFISSYEQRLQTVLLKSYWGHFGWLDTLMPESLYILIRWGIYLSIAGLVAYASRSWSTRTWTREQKGILVASVSCLAIAGLLGFYGYLRWQEYSVYQPSQGRYFMHGIAFQMLLMVTGLIELTPRNLRPAMHVAVRTGFIAINVGALVLTIVPRYYVLKDDPTPTISNWAAVSSPDGSSMAGIAFQPQREGLSALTVWLQTDEAVEQVQVQIEETSSSGRQFVSEPIDLSATLTPVRIVVPSSQLVGAVPMYVTATSIVSPSRQVSIMTTTDWHYDPPVSVEYSAESPAEWWEHLVFLTRSRFEQAEVLLDRLSQLKPGVFKGGALIGLASIALVGTLLLVILLVNEPRTGHGGREWIPLLIGAALGAGFVGWGFQMGHSPDWVTIDLAESTRTLRSLEQVVHSDLPLALDDWSTRIEDPKNHVSLRWVEINQEARLAIWMHAPSAAVFHVTIPPNAELCFDLALAPETWEAEQGDGVAFIAAISQEDVIETIFWEVVDPRKNPEQRGWLHRSVDLSPYAGQVVNLRLQTQPLANNDWDWSMWGAPRIVSRSAP